MSTIINKFKQHKKIILILGLILLIPFLIPIIELLIKMLFIVGNYVGTNIRHIMENNIC